MKPFIRRAIVSVCVLSAGLFITCPRVARAEDAKPATQPAKGDYKPREGRRPPKQTSGGGTRGRDDKLPGDAFVFFVLAPDEVVEKDAAEVPVAPLTVSPQPRLFWYISKPTEEKFVFALTDGRQNVAKAALGEPRQGGIQTIDLADAKLLGKSIELKLDVDYTWSIRPESSRKITASGLIRRSTQPPQISPGDPSARAASLAEAGIWYDALAAISEAIDKNPQDAALRQRRASLLEHAGLGVAADADRPAV